MKTGHSQTRLDPHAPLVLDTRELGRRPGSMREVQRTVPSPEGLGAVDLLGVPVGAQVVLDLRMESVMEGVLVTGEATAPLVGQCGRCLDPLEDELVVDLQELFAYADSTSVATTDEDELARMDGDLLDLEPVLRDAVVLALPVTPLCDEDCAGLCPTCGERLDDLPEDHDHDAVDPRWGALAGLADAPSGILSDRPTQSRPEEQ